MVKIATKESNIECSQHEEEEEKGRGQKDSLLYNLCPELLDLIWSHLLAFDPSALGTIRLICKSWRLTARPPPLPHRLTHYEYPYLMSLKDSTCKFFHPTYNYSFHFDIPELLGSYIRYSKYGWLLLSRKGQNSVKSVDYFFFNPCTGVKIMLPSVSIEEEFLSMCFSSLPTSSDYFVIGVGFIGMTFAIIRPGDGMDWSFNYIYDFDYCMPYGYPVIYQQKCYFMKPRGKLTVFDPINQSISKVCESVYYEEHDLLYRCLLLETDEDLLGVFVTEEEKCPYVMRMDFSKEIWEPINSLEDKMIYVSPVRSFIMSAPTKGTGNKIYFPKFGDGNCIFYSLATKKYHSFSGDYSEDIPCKVKEMTNCEWITLMI